MGSRSTLTRGELLALEFVVAVGLYVGLRGFRDSFVVVDLLAAVAIVAVGVVRSRAIHRAESLRDAARWSPVTVAAVLSVVWLGGRFSWVFHSRFWPDDLPLVALVVLAAVVTVRRPEIGVPLSSGIALCGEHEMWPFVLPGVAAVAFATREWRRPLTWVVAGLALRFAGWGLFYDLERVGAASTVRGVGYLEPRLALDLALAVGALAVLRDRTWGVFAMCAAALATTAAAPYVTPPRTYSCFGDPSHPLALIPEELGLIWLPLVLAWLWPMLRWLSARDRLRTPNVSDGERV